MTEKTQIYPLSRLTAFRALVTAVVVLLPFSAHAQCTINMSGADQQPIDGFGFSTAWCSAISDEQAQVLYGTGNGQLGFSLLRCRMDVGNPWFRYVESQIANADIAHSYGAKVMGTQWAVPSQWSGPLGLGDGGRLIPSASADYAKYLKEKAEKMGLDYVSFQNEPDLCNWSPTDVYNFVRDYGDTLGKPLIMPESFWFDSAYSDPVLNDPVTASKFSIVAGHIYGKNPDKTAILGDHSNALARGKRIWQTEHFSVVELPDGTKTIGDHNTAMKVAKEVSDCMNAQMSAYIWWWIAVTSEDSFIQGTTVDKRGYMLGQFSKYIRPGSTRVSADYQPQAGISVTAYRVNGGCTIVALNTSMSAVRQDFSIQNGSATKLEGYQTTISENMADIGSFNVSGGNFTATLPPQSVTTFVQATTPVIVHQPEDVNVFPGGNAKFMVTAAGIQMKYQWYFNGTTVLAGATGPILNLTGAQASQAGTYSVVISNGSGSVTSSAVRLAVSPLVWSPPVAISSDADISTNGSFLYAYNNSGSDATVNGVTFAGVNSASTWGNGVTLSGLDGSLDSTFAGGSNAPWSGLSSSYQKILQGGAFLWGSGKATVTLKNLVAGHQYQVQVWVNDSRGGGSAARTETVTGANTVTLAYNTTQVTGALGQYTIGAFTATGATQSFTLDGKSGTTQINAIQVRDVTSMISWATPMAISSPTDISTLGELLYAYSGSGSSTTVNGVPFTGENSITNWGTGVTLLGWSQGTLSSFEGGGSRWSSKNSPWDNLPKSYKMMLQGGTYSWSGASTVQLNSLTPGHQYQVQVWIHDCNNRFITQTLSGANTVAVEQNSLQAQDGLGQFVTGIFTATGTTQSFTIDGGVNKVQLNALQVRDVSGNLKWNSPETIASAADISTAGVLVYAYNNSGSSAVVNGVEFTGVDSATTWGSGVTLSAMNDTTASAYTGVSYPWSSLPTSYQTILRGGAYNNGGPAIVTMNNLVFGHRYQVQIWVNDSRASNRTGTLISADGSMINLAYNDTRAAGGVGQYAIGGFTAMSTTQSFTFGSASSSQINAIQVRDVSGITWSTPSNISSASDVSTNGTLLYAYNNSGNSALINGVAFTGVDSPTAWGSGVTLFGLNGSQTSAFAGGSNAPWSSLPAAYQTILQGGAFIWGSGSANVTLNNLVAGRQYQVQVWVNDSRASTRTQTLVSTGGRAVSLAYDSTQVVGGVGQYTIGTFTAAATTQTFTMNGGIDTPQINAIQVREITEAPYELWASNRSLGLTPGSNDAPAADPDGDGMSNLMEFALGGEPMVSSQSELPVLKKSADSLLFQYSRNRLSLSPATSQVVEYGSDLIGWTAVRVDTDTSGVVSIEREDRFDRVTVTIPPGDNKIFVRLKVTK